MIAADRAVWDSVARSILARRSKPPRVWAVRTANGPPCVQEAKLAAARRLATKIGVSEAEAQSILEMTGLK